MMAAGLAETETGLEGAAAGTPLWLDHPGALDVAVVGGKAAPLARLRAEGVRVPPGFVVPAAAYRAAVAPLRDRIDALLAGAPEGEALAAAAGEIRELVLAAPM